MCQAVLTHALKACSTLLSCALSSGAKLTPQKFSREFMRYSRNCSCATSYEFAAHRSMVSILLSSHSQFDATVASASVFSIVRCHGTVLTEALRRDSIRSYALGYELCLDGLGS
jgi:hypothetical protein